MECDDVAGPRRDLRKIGKEFEEEGVDLEIVLGALVRLSVHRRLFRPSSTVSWHTSRTAVLRPTRGGQQVNYLISASSRSPHRIRRHLPGIRAGTDDRGHRGRHRATLSRFPWSPSSSAPSEAEEIPLLARPHERTPALPRSGQGLDPEDGAGPPPSSGRSEEETEVQPPAHEVVGSALPRSSHCQSTMPRRKKPGVRPSARRVPGCTRNNLGVSVLVGSADVAVPGVPQQAPSGGPEGCSGVHHVSRSHQGRR